MLLCKPPPNEKARKAAYRVEMKAFTVKSGSSQNCRADILFQSRTGDFVFEITKDQRSQFNGTKNNIAWDKTGPAWDFSDL